MAAISEGRGCPAVEVAVLARVFGACGPYLQAVGRAFRRSPDGQRGALVGNLSAAAILHGLPSALASRRRIGESLAWGSGKEKIVTALGTPRREGAWITIPRAGVEINSRQWISAGSSIDHAKPPLKRPHRERGRAFRWASRQRSIVAAG